MKTIWKFPMELDGIQAVAIPAEGKILAVQTQNNAPCIWAEVDPDNVKQQRQFLVMSTGHIIPPEFDNREYLGTVQTHAGSFVWHVFEILGQNL